MPYTENGTGYANTDTSHQAALSIEPKKGTIAAEVLAFLRNHSQPYTADEIAEHIERPFLSVRPRCSELALSGHLQDSGKRKTGRYGKPAIAWAAV